LPFGSQLWWQQMKAKDRGGGEHQKGGKACLPVPLGSGHKRAPPVSAAIATAAAVLFMTPLRYACIFGIDFFCVS
jgi:hypothetical protein